jgi:hypothetical protein
MKHFFMYLIALTFSASTLSAQTITPLYVNFFTHNEERDYCTGRTSDIYCYFPPALPASQPCGYQDQTVFLKLRGLLKELADTVRADGAKWNWESDWVFLAGVRSFDKGDAATGGKNIVKWIAENNNGAIEIDAHAHESTYNYADVAYMLDSLGGKPSKVVGGFTWNFTQGNNTYTWMDFDNGIKGWKYPNFTWKPDILWGAAGYNRRRGQTDHAYDVETPGIWQPKDTSETGFKSHDPSKRLILLGNGYGKANDSSKTAEQIAGEIIAFADSLRQGTKPPAGRLYSYSIDLHQKFWACPGYVARTAKVIELLKPYVQQGRIVWATNTEKVTAWKAQYKSQPNLYPFAQNIVSGISSEKIAEGRLGLAIAPNPADDQAVAYFILTRPERVSLRLYNVLGQEVALLLDAELEAGEHAIQLPLGHYPSSFVFVRISSASFSITKSVQVLR